MDKPLVSIIIPTYNRLYPLAELIESLSRQTYKKFEVIIVNDAGTAVEQLISLYPELEMTIINLEHNKKHVHARNEGVKAAKGECIMVIDDDDLIVPDHIERLVDNLQGYSLVYSDAEIINYKVEDNIRYPVNRLLFAFK